MGSLRNPPISLAQPYSIIPESGGVAADLTLRVLPAISQHLDSREDGHPADDTYVVFGDLG